MDMNTKIKTKQKISLLMAVVMLMTMIPMGSFALKNFQLMEVSREYMVGGADHTGSAEIKVPVSEFGVPTDIEPSNLSVKEAYTTGGYREIVDSASIKYEAYVEKHPDEDPDPNREVNKFGYIIFSY